MERFLEYDLLEVQSLKQSIFLHPVSEVYSGSAREGTLFKLQIDYSTSLIIECSNCRCRGDLGRPNYLRHCVFVFLFSMFWLHEIFSVFYDCCQYSFQVLIGQALNLEADSCALAAFYSDLLLVS